jgi:hypothetical protein
MPRVVAVALPSDRTEDLVGELQAVEGLLALWVFPGGSRQPPGDVVDAEMTDRYPPTMMHAIDRYFRAVGTGVSVTMSEPTGMIWLAGTAADRTANGWTVQRWLPHWLDTRSRIRPTTRFHYTSDVEIILIPYLGRYRLADLGARLLRAVFDQIARTTNTKGLPSPRRRCGTCAPRCGQRSTSPCEGVIDCNPARHIEITGYQQLHAKVWTEARVEQWEQIGDRPAVAVWTVDQLATFLGRGDRRSRSRSGG